MKIITLHAEAEVYRDSDISRSWFEEFEAGYEGYPKQLLSNGRQTDMVVIYDGKKQPDDRRFTLEELEAMSVQDLVTLSESVQYWHIDDTMAKEDIIHDLIQVTHEDYYEALHAETQWRNLEPDMVVSGHCQGDAIAVFFEGDVIYTSKELENLFYNTPVSGTVSIIANDEVVDELYISEFTADAYEWDKEYVIKQYLKTDRYDPFVKMVAELLEDCLPDELEYR